MGEYPTYLVAATIHCSVCTRVVGALRDSILFVIYDSRIWRKEMRFLPASPLRTRGLAIEFVFEEEFLW